MVNGLCRPIRILSVLGTRPEVIKLSPVIKEIERRTATGAMKSVVCLTGQQPRLLKPLLEFFQIVPGYVLESPMKRSLSQSAATIVSQLEPILIKENPDWVLLQGDTTTVAAASLAAFYNRRRVAHVEAGLRTNDKWRPFPEEINRKIASLASDLHFAPTSDAVAHLLASGIPAKQVMLTGNPGIDALRLVSKQPPPQEFYRLLRELDIYHDHELSRDSSAQAGAVRLGSRNGLSHGLQPQIMIATIHRRESFGRPVKEICAALRQVAEAYGDRIKIVLPLHTNPQASQPIRCALSQVRNIFLTRPLNYPVFIHLLKRADMILTDSGGIQEEAATLGKPTLVAREITERVESLAIGSAILVGVGRDRVAHEIGRLLDDKAAHRAMMAKSNVYGDGRAAKRITDALFDAGGVQV